MVPSMDAMNVPRAIGAIFALTVRAGRTKQPNTHCQEEHRKCLRRVSGHRGYLRLRDTILHLRRDRVVCCGGLRRHGSGPGSSSCRLSDRILQKRCVFRRFGHACARTAWWWGRKVFSQPAERKLIIQTRCRTWEPAAHAEVRFTDVPYFRHRRCAGCFRQSLCA
jgi:hypothetical protein